MYTQSDLWKFMWEFVVCSNVRSTQLVSCAVCGGVGGWICTKLTCCGYSATINARSSPHFVLSQLSLCSHLQNLLLLPVSHLQDHGRGERAVWEPLDCGTAFRRGKMAAHIRGQARDGRCSSYFSRTFSCSFLSTSVWFVRPEQPSKEVWTAQGFKLSSPLHSIHQVESFWFQFITHI